MSHAGLNQPIPVVRPTTTPERLAAIEARQDQLEHTLISMVRDLSIQVAQMHRTQLAAIEAGGHHHEPATPAAPEIVFTFLEALSVNSMYRVYQDAPDHPICPNALNVHTRVEDADHFDSVPIDPVLLEVLSKAFIEQIGHVPNKVFFVEVHRISDQPLDESSVLVG